jgi:Ca2+-binding RTX toxin-like protein
VSTGPDSVLGPFGGVFSPSASSSSPFGSPQVAANAARQTTSQQADGVANASTAAPALGLAEGTADNPHMFSTLEHHAIIPGGVGPDDPINAGSGISSAGQPVGSIAQLADYLVNGYWTQFAHTVAHHWPSNTITYNLGNLNASEQNLALSALTLWAQVANIAFAQAGTASINFNHNGNMQAFTSGSWNGSGQMTSATVDISSNWISTYGGGATYSYGFQTYIHEIGHALGLGHQGPYNGSGTYGTSNIYANDTWQFSVMSYFSEPNYDGGSYDYVITPQMADITAVQSIYGAASTRTGNTTYGFNNNAGSIYDFTQYSGTPALTIYDSGGTDTLDCSGYSQNQTINLTPGAFCSIGGYSHNIGIFTTTTIEAAVGGSGSDTIVGNSANNTLTGGRGNDTIDGGAGTDTATYSGSRSQYLATLNANGSYHIVDMRAGAPDGTDDVSNVEFFQFADLTVTAGALVNPDFTATQILLSGASISCRINNVGLAAAAGSTTGIYLSTDTTITTSDTLLTTLSTPPLATNSSDIESISLFSLSFPSNLVPGTYYLGVVANYNGQMAESNGTNNASNAVAIILGNDNDNTLNGTLGNDTILGFDGIDVMRGLGGDDVLIPGHGNDILDGGDGFNVAYYSRPSAGYGVLNYQGQLYVGNPTDGLDTLINIQAINFEDASASRVGSGLDYIASYSDLIKAFGANETAGARHFLDHGWAEGRTIPFNGLDYIASYGDLIRAFGANEQAGATHFIDNGFNEGRHVTFNGLDYVASYGDLIRAFGANEQAGATHYIEHGLNEGRNVTFNGLDYIASYGDLIRAFGANEQAGATHYINHGFNEGRHVAFNGLEYIASYGDLIRAFGANEQVGATHYIEHGFNEGRGANLFDPEAYLTKYPDLRAAFGHDDHAATVHWIMHGFYEGRDWHM